MGGSKDMKHGKAYEKLLSEYLKDPNKAIEQLEYCNYECEAGTLTNNVAWRAIKMLLGRKG